MLSNSDLNSTIALNPQKAQPRDGKPTPLFLEHLHVTGIDGTRLNH
jgi:hypothetical protein